MTNASLLRGGTRRTAAVATAAFALIGPAANAAIITWVPTGGGDFNAPANWTGAVAPTVADTAVFEENASGTISLSAPISTQVLSFRKTTGTVTLDLAGSTLTLGSTTQAPTISLGPAAGQVNNVTITGGALPATHTTGTALLVVGANAASSGNTLTFTGIGTALTSPSTGNVGTVGVTGSTNNTLNVLNGANVNLRGNVALGVVAAGSSGNSINVNGATFSSVGGSRGFNLNNGVLNLTNSYTDTGFLLANAAGNNTTINFNSGQIYSRRTQFDNGRDFVIGDGGATPAIIGLAYSGGTMTIGSVAAPVDLVLNSNGILTGASGTVTINGTGKLRGLAGAKVSPAIVGQPSLTTDDRPTGTLSLVGAWDNTNLELLMDVGDFPTAAAAPSPFTPLDFINITGVFTHGGVVSFNVAGYVAPASPSEIKVIGWTSESGSNASTSVQFVGGASLPYRFGADGLYLTVPEPAAASLIAASLLLVRRKRIA